MKRLLCLLCAAFACIGFCSCGNDEEEVNLQYELPVETMFEAIEAKDSKSFLRCFAAPVIDEYEGSDEYDENIAETIDGLLCSQSSSEDISFHQKITDKRELSSEEIKELSDGISKRHNVKKAFEITVRIIVFPEDDVDVSYSQELKLVVGKLSGNWYICQSPVMEWNLIKDVKDVKRTNS